MVLLFQHPAGLGHGTPRSPVCMARVTTSFQYWENALRW